MANKTTNVNPIAAAVGVAFVTSLAASSTAVAADNPFETADLDSGYLLAGDEKGEEGKCSEGSCSGDKGEEGSCSGEKGEEGSCSHEKGEEGSCSGGQA